MCKKLPLCHPFCIQQLLLSFEFGLSHRRFHHFPRQHHTKAPICQLVVVVVEVKWKHAWGRVLATTFDVVPYVDPMVDLLCCCCWICRRCLLSLRPSLEAHKVKHVSSHWCPSLAPPASAVWVVEIPFYAAHYFLENKYYFNPFKCIIYNIMSVLISYATQF